MLIAEVSKVTSLTKKAIEYYIEQGLVNPVVLDNGYRDFSETDVERLQKIAVLRKLGFSIEEIREVLADQTNSTLQKLSVQRELKIRAEEAKKAIIEKLIRGHGYDEISAELKAVEQGTTAAEKILAAFPGYYGQFVCLHFARFLQEPITTAEQQAAYEEIIAFLDNVPPLAIPEDLQAFLDESTKHFNTENIEEMIENTRQAVADPEKFFTENRKIMEQYLEYRRSDEYKNSPAYKLQTLLKEFYQTSGYYDIFIPAMKKLSLAYAEYYKQLEAANKKFLTLDPEAAQQEN